MKQTDRIAKLEDEVKQLKRQNAELRVERDAADKLVAAQADHIEDANAFMDRLVEALDLVLDDNGQWTWNEWVQKRDELWEKNQELIRDWNAFVPKYNAVVAPRVRNFGRPLAASPAQQADVLKRRKAGESLRGIAEDTGLSFQTVRTIVDKPDRKDRATLARLERRQRDRHAEAGERLRKKARDALPRHINEMIKRGAELRKRAKGLK